MRIPAPFRYWYQASARSYCIAAPPRAGGAAVLHVCANNNTYAWVLVGVPGNGKYKDWSRIQSKAGGKNLCLTDPSGTAGKLLVFETCNAGNGGQAWSWIRFTHPGFAYVNAVHSNCVTRSGSVRNGAPIVSAVCGHYPANTLWSGI